MYYGNETTNNNNFEIKKTSRNTNKNNKNTELLTHPAQSKLSNGLSVMAFEQVKVENSSYLGRLEDSNEVFQLIQFIIICSIVFV